MERFEVTEWHSVALVKSYEIDEPTVVEAFGSVERFKEVLSHQGEQPIGEEPTDEESDAFWDYVSEGDFVSEEDWYSARKGGFETTVKL